MLLLGTIASLSLTRPVYGETEDQSVVYEREEELTSPVIEVNQNFEEEIVEEQETMTEEELLSFVTAYCGTTKEELLSLVNYIMIESQKKEIAFEESKEVLSIFYHIAQTPWEEKVGKALETSGLTQDELTVVASIVSAESKKVGSMEPCYIDSYGVINNIDSRTDSAGWRSYGNTIYEQATRRGQYVVYPVYSRKYLGIINRAYRATVDFLYADYFCKENNLPLLKPTRWTQFRSPSKMKPGRTQIVPNGNAYFGEIPEGQLLETYIPSENPKNFLATINQATKLAQEEEDQNLMNISSENTKLILKLK